MKKAVVAIALVSLALLAGCVPCLHAIYTDKDLVYEPGLVGVWSQADAKGAWHFTKAGEKAYRLVQTDDQGRPGEFSAHLVKIGETLLLDLYPETPDLPKNDFYKFYLRPTHTFFLVQEITPELRLSFMDFKWLQEYVEKNPGAVRHEETEQGLLLTASTKELQAFVAHHAKTNEAWHAVPGMKKKPER